MQTLCLDCYNLICEDICALPEDVPPVPVLEDGVCPVCHGTTPLDLDWILA